MLSVNLILFYFKGNPKNRHKICFNIHNCLDVLGLFDRIKSENDGRLDVLVNNAYAGVSLIDKSTGQSVSVF